ncbi:MAG: PEGA domain-containing protein, partial [bacterium]|nr:PEGA domain-containing protein [bacterium]
MMSRSRKPTLGSMFLALMASAKAKKLIVRIAGDNVEGSGIVFGVDGNRVFGVTAKHVLFQRGKILTGLRAYLRPWNGSFPLQGTRFHHRKDMAVFEIDVASLGLSPGEIALAFALDQLGGTDDLDPGAEINTIGHATGGAWIDSKAPGRFIDFEAFADPAQRDTLKLEHFCPPGHSGGGVFDKDWHLIGMIFDNQEPFCRALKVESLQEILRDWKYDVQWQAAVPRDEAPAVPQILTVAVVDFDNRSGARLPEIGPAACDIVTSFLFNMPGVTVVTRDRLGSVLREQNLNPTKLSTEGYSRLGQILDADAIVTGSVTRYDVERRTLHSYDLNVLADIYRMSINLQVIDINSGVVEYSDEFEIDDKKTYPDGSSAPRRPLSRESELLHKLLKEQASEGVQRALRQIKAGPDSAGTLIAVPITSTPEGADILVNGIFEGTTPATLDLSSTVHEIEVRLRGYAPWRRRVNIE